MTEVDLELLITLDDPDYAPEEDMFSHLQAHNLGYWLGRQYPTSNQLDQSSVSDQQQEEWT